MLFRSSTALELERWYNARTATVGETDYTQALSSVLDEVEAGLTQRGVLNSLEAHLNLSSQTPSPKSHT